MEPPLYDKLAGKNVTNGFVHLRHCLHDVFDGRKAAILLSSRKIGIDMSTERFLQVLQFLWQLRCLLLFVRDEQVLPFRLDVTQLDLALKEELGQWLGVNERLNHSVHVTRITQVVETDEGVHFGCHW